MRPQETDVERTRRIGLNEALFRGVNDEINRLETDGSGPAFETITILCECGDAECVEQLPLELAAYRELRSDPVLFAVSPGHDAPDVETVVARRGTYDVVRKDAGMPANIARRTDPRSS